MILRTEALKLSRLYESPRQSSALRARLTICLAVFGGVLGAAQFLINLLAQTQFPKDPERLALTASLIVSSRALVAGLVVAAILARLATSEWAGQRPDRARHLLVWVATGIGYGVLTPVVAGMLVPLSGLILQVATGAMTIGTALTWIPDTILRAPYAGMIFGAVGLSTGLIAGVVFAVGGWLIDAANASSDPKVSRYSAWVVMLAFSVAIVGITVLVPPAVLAKLG